MSALDLSGLLGKTADSPEIEQALEFLGTLRRPDLEEDDGDRWHDWVLVKRRGVEFGFVRQSYFEARLQYDWTRGPLLCNQIYFYAAGFNNREDIHGYAGVLPFGLDFTDSRDVTRSKLHQWKRWGSDHTDRWDTDTCKLHVRYAPTGSSIECVTIALPIYEWPEEGRIEPNVAAAQWLALFGEQPGSERLRAAVAPLDIISRIDECEQDREADFVRECGLELHFEDADELRLSPEKKAKGLVLGAVKFFRARDREARQWSGELPYGLSFDDAPDSFALKLGRPADVRKDDRVTGFAVWNFKEASLHVLYSNFDNHLLRVTLMAPGYWSEIEKPY
ncbi:hypothetical protein [Burkholderia ubonensis]|uniref:hypothetical protein n=1 Tax=Burkholderia ubonensis TaxID=101571 RepID=UPI0011605D31|nr:hypothetical protein [Burkholderia ubonensis]